MCRIPGDALFVALQSSVKKNWTQLSLQYKYSMKLWERKSQI